MRVYNSNAGAVKRPRRRIGEPSQQVKQYIQSLSTWDKVKREVQSLSR